MASFSIPDIPSKIELAKGAVDAAGKAVRAHSGNVVFAVSNTAGEIITGKISVLPDGAAKPEWFAVDGEVQRDFGLSGSETVKVKIAVPADTAAGDYGFKLCVASVNDPDNDFAISPATGFPVAAPEVIGEPKPKSKWWLWLLIALVVLAALGGGAYALFGGKEKPEPKDEPTAAPTLTPTSEPVATTGMVPNLIGKTVANAQGLSEGFDFTPIAGLAEGKEPNTILTQAPAAGTNQNLGIPLKVTFDPGVSVPDLRGQTPEQVINVLNRAGLHVQETKTRCVGSGTAGSIVDTTPAPNAQVAKNIGVTLHVAVVNGMAAGRRFGCGILIEDIRILRVPVTEATFVPMERATMVPRMRVQ